MITTNELSTIRFDAKYDDYGFPTEIACRWDGDTRFVAASVEFLEEADPEFTQFWGEARYLEPGDLVQLCTYVLRVHQVHGDLIVLERISGKDGTVQRGCG